MLDGDVTDAVEVIKILKKYKTFLPSFYTHFKDQCIAIYRVTLTTKYLVNWTFLKFLSIY